MCKIPSCLQVVPAARGLEESKDRLGGHNRRWEVGVALEEGMWIMSEEGENGQVGTREVSMQGLVAERCQLSEGEEMGLLDNRREMNKRTCLEAGRVLKCDSVRGSRVRGWGQDFCRGFVGPSLLLPAESTRGLASHPCEFRSRFNVIH